MFIKTKISVAALVIASFVIGGFTFNAYQARAVGNGDGGHKFGFLKGGFHGLSGIDKDSPEWQAKMEKWKTKMEEFKINMSENGEWRGRGLRYKYLFGFKGLKGFTDEVNYEVVNIDNGVQITITSGNPDVVQKLQEHFVKIQ